MRIQIIPLFSGSTGNCILVRAGETNLLVDAGVTAKALTGALLQTGLRMDSIDAVLITHEHADHIRGLPVLVKKYGVPVYATEGTWRMMHGKFREIPKFRPVFLPDGSFYIGELGVETFPLSHDAAQPVGFSFFMMGEKASIATDTGYVSKGMIRALEGSATVLLESNHDPVMLQTGPYPGVLKRRVASRKGHLANEDCARVLAHLAQTGTKQAILGHLSQKNNTPELAYAASSQALLELGIDPENDFSLTVASAAMFQED